VGSTAPRIKGLGGHWQGKSNRPPDNTHAVQVTEQGSSSYQDPKSFLMAISNNKFRGQWLF